MKTLFLGVCAAALLPAAASAAHFTFTDVTDYNFPDGGQGLITGSFDGDLGAGGLITNLSNAAFTLDGIASTGSIYIESYGCGYTGFCNSGATASLDGSQNNFLFINSNYANGDYSFTQYFYSLPNAGYGDYGYNASPYLQLQNNGTHFNAQIASVPEPASWALMLGGFGMIGGAMRSRRKAEVSFG